MRLGYLLTSFEGRINRKPLWLATILMVVVSIAIFAIVFAATPPDGVGPNLLVLIVQLVLLYPSTALIVKRLHDRDRPGYFAAFVMVPAVLKAVTDYWASRAIQSGRTRSITCSAESSLSPASGSS